MKFIDFISESINDAGIFKAIFMAGQSLSGKTYVINRISSGRIDARIVNIDKMFEFLVGKIPSYAELVDKSKKLTKDQLILYLNSMLPLFIDSTSTNPNATVRRQGLLSSLGYDTGMVFVNCSLDTSLRRLQARARKVPEEFIRERYQQIEELKPFYESIFNKFFIEVNNDDGELNNTAIKNAFNATTGFFEAPLKNPLGKQVMEEMTQNGWKYLFDGSHTKEYLEKIVSMWFYK